MGERVVRKVVDIISKPRGLYNCELLTSYYSQVRHTFASRDDPLLTIVSLSSGPHRLQVEVAMATRVSVMGQVG